MRRTYETSVFINCPFDDSYQPLFNALVFTVKIAGFQPRCALEADNFAQVRLAKIIEIISQCKYGIHDISRTELSNSGLPRFNMPLELGIDLGCINYGGNQHRDKRLLVMDRKRYRYQKFISDLAGQDIRAHENSAKKVVSIVRDWLSVGSGKDDIPGGDYIYNQYKKFIKAIPELKLALKLDERLNYPDFVRTVRIWLEENEV